MKPRILYLEVLRIIATIAVLINHIPLVAVHLYDDWAGDGGRFVINGIVHVVHFAVPVFVMITGALLLNKEKPISYRKAWNYVWRMIVILGTVGVAFAWMEIYFGERHFNLVQIPNAILNTLWGKSWSHLWYLYMLIGLYIVLPMLKATVNNLTNKQLDILIAILFLFAFINPMLRHFAEYSIGIIFPMMSIYATYMLIGYRISSIKTFNFQTCIYICLFVFFYIFMAYIEYFKGHLSLTFLAEYNSPLMAIYSILIFCMVQQIKITSINKFWMTFSRDSFGIYVFHMLYVNVVYKVLKINPFEDGIWTFLPIFIGVAGLSWLTTIIFRKIPWVGNYI